jgi:tRNA (mo5U34)-methyltransferase
MAEPRIALQAALAAVLTAKTEAEREGAMAQARRALDQVAAEPFVEPAADAGSLVAREPETLRIQSKKLRWISDQNLSAFNRLLPWGAMTIDDRGRIVGNAWSMSKRAQPHMLIDPRQKAFDQRFPLSGKHVAEIGCFEGIHSLGCLLLGAKVTAVDGRMENILKTLARLWAYGRATDVILWNVEEAPPPQMPARWDVLHHIGVLYHLADPVGHLNALLPKTGEALLLDTHVALDDEDASAAYEVEDTTYRYRRRGEIVANPFAGLMDHAKWLRLEDLVGIVRSHGFSDVEIVEDRKERNGRRVMIWAFR